MSGQSDGQIDGQMFDQVPCNMMAFVLPCLFHLIVFWDNMGFLGRFLKAVG